MTGRQYLLDTHILIWALDQTDKIPLRYRPLLAQEEMCAVSIISIWEIAIKKGLGKLQIRDGVADFVRRTGVEILPVTISHIDVYETLPHHHRDPFDRMLIAQAMSENLQIMTVDRNFPLYDITVT